MKLWHHVFLTLTPEGHEQLASCPAMLPMSKYSITHHREDCAKKNQHLPIVSSNTDTFISNKVTQCAYIPVHDLYHSVTTLLRSFNLLRRKIRNQFSLKHCHYLAECAGAWRAAEQRTSPPRTSGSTCASRLLLPQNPHHRRSWSIAYDHHLHNTMMLYVSPF